MRFRTSPIRQSYPAQCILLDFCSLQRVETSGPGPMVKSNKAAKPRQTRIQVEVPDAVAEAIDDYRFAARAPNRAEAVRRLLNAGRTAQRSRRRPH